MCACALMGIPNRMVVEGEQLVVHRFRTGSLDLAAPDSTDPPTRRPPSFWIRLKLFFTPTQRDSIRGLHAAGHNETAYQGYVSQEVAI